MPGLLTKEPVVRTRPHRWRAAVLKRLAERSGEMVGIDRGGDRRVLACANPGLGGAPDATSTIWAAAQYLGRILGLRWRALRARRHDDYPELDWLYAEENLAS